MLSFRHNKEFRHLAYFTFLNVCFTVCVSEMAAGAPRQELPIPVVVIAKDTL